jgi:broad specificity phosphatase PhoE
MVAAVKALDRRHPEGDVVVVGHQDPIQTVRILLTGRDLRQQHRDKPVHGAVCTLRPGTPWKDLGIWAPGS